MHITSSYYRYRQHRDTLNLGFGRGIARVVDQAALKVEAKFSECSKPSIPLSPLSEHFNVSHAVINQPEIR